MSPRAVLMLVLVGILAGGAARANGAPAISSIWHVDGPSVHLRVAVSPEAARWLLPAGRRFDPAAMASAAGAALGVGSAAGACPALVLNQYVGRTNILPDPAGGVRFEMRFRCPVQQGMVLHDHLLFDQLPDHVDAARVERGDTTPALRLFTRAGQALVLPPDGSVPSQPLFDLLVQGAVRACDRPGGVLVLCALLLARGAARRGAVPLALALGHAAALATTWSGLIVLDLPLAAACVAGLPALLGLQALRRRSSPRTGTGTAALPTIAVCILVCAVLVAICATRGRTAVCVAIGLALLAFANNVDAVRQDGVLASATLFGLVDGAGWADGLAGLHLPRDSLLLPELGDAIGACTGLGALWMLGSLLLRASRQRFGLIRPLGAELCAALLLGLGLFRFVRTVMHA